MTQLSNLAGSVRTSSGARLATASTAAFSGAQRAAISFRFRVDANASGGNSFFFGTSAIPSQSVIGLRRLNASGVWQVVVATTAGIGAVNVTIDTAKDYLIQAVWDRGGMTSADYAGISAGTRLVAWITDLAAGTTTIVANTTTPLESAAGAWSGTVYAGSVAADDIARISRLALWADTRPTDAQLASIRAGDTDPWAASPTLAWLLDRGDLGASVADGQPQLGEIMAGTLAMTISAGTPTWSERIGPAISAAKDPGVSQAWTTAAAPNWYRGLDQVADAMGDADQTIFITQGDSFGVQNLLRHQAAALVRLADFVPITGVFGSFTDVGGSGGATTVYTQVAASGSGVRDRNDANAWSNVVQASPLTRYGVPIGRLHLDAADGVVLGADDLAYTINVRSVHNQTSLGGGANWIGPNGTVKCRFFYWCPSDPNTLPDAVDIGGTLINPRTQSRQSFTGALGAPVPNAVNIIGADLPFTADGSGVVSVPVKLPSFGATETWSFLGVVCYRADGSGARVPGLTVGWTAASSANIDDFAVAATPTVDASKQHTDAQMAALLLAIRIDARQDRVLSLASIATESKSQAQMETAIAGWVNRLQSQAQLAGMTGGLARLAYLVPMMHETNGNDLGADRGNQIAARDAAYAVAAARSDVAAISVLDATRGVYRATDQQRLASGGALHNNWGTLEDGQAAVLAAAQVLTIPTDGLHSIAGDADTLRAGRELVAAPLAIAAALGTRRTTRSEPRLRYPVYYCVSEENTSPALPSSLAALGVVAADWDGDARHWWPNGGASAEFPAGSGAGVKTVGYTAGRSEPDAWGDFFLGSPAYADALAARDAGRVFLCDIEGIARAADGAIAKGADWRISLYPNVQRALDQVGTALKLAGVPYVPYWRPTGGAAPQTADDIAAWASSGYFRNALCVACQCYSRYSAAEFASDPANFETADDLYDFDGRGDRITDLREAGIRVGCVVAARDIGGGDPITREQFFEQFALANRLHAEAAAAGTPELFGGLMVWHGYTPVPSEIADIELWTRQAVRAYVGRASGRLRLRSRTR